ncbi:MAG: hypothetical protein L6R41_001044, partial [Letrouitia leprolyta]
KCKGYEFRLFAVVAGKTLKDLTIDVNHAEGKSSECCQDIFKGLMIFLTVIVSKRQR